MAEGVTGQTRVALSAGPVTPESSFNRPMMSMSKDLIQSNSQIYRVYYRRLANPADQDIFITSANKLTSFFSDARAYYAEAQEPVRPQCLQKAEPSSFTCDCSPRLLCSCLS